MRKDINGLPFNVPDDETLTELSGAFHPSTIIGFTLLIFFSLILLALSFYTGVIYANFAWAL